MVRQELITLEQEVLGGPIIDNSLYHHLKENVKERMFVVPEHKEIFKFISEMFEKDNNVYCYDTNGNVKKYKVEQLCPYPFGKEDL